ncbi:MAG: hypothetical protein SGPRY_014770 [Prymnesium sp.]
MGSLVKAGRALRDGVKRSRVLQRRSERFALPQLYERYKKNTLTHGREFLVGEDEICFVGEDIPAPLAWRAIPREGGVSFSRARVGMSGKGHVILQGHYGGAASELHMIPGQVEEGKAPAVGRGACGMASTGHWNLDLTQHHWLELKLRSDARLYELVIQYDGYYEGVHALFRCELPRGPKPSAQAVKGGAYGVLGVAQDAGQEELQRAYKKLALKLHPDRGGDEEQFKRVSKAFDLLSNPERRERYDQIGPEEEEEEGLNALGDWRTLKVPFTAFKDRKFFEIAEQVATVYVLLCDDKPGPFAFELAELKAGRCKNARLVSADIDGTAACELGFCECGYYNGLRAEPFSGPVQRNPDGSLPDGAIEFGHAEHHYTPEDYTA